MSGTTPVVDPPTVKPAPKPSSKRAFLDDAGSVFGSNMTVLVFGMLTSIILNRGLGPELKGLYVGLLVYPSLLTSLAEMGVKKSTLFAIGQRRHETESVVGAVSCLYWLTTAIGVFGCLGIYALLNNPGFTNAMIALALVSIPFGLLRSYANGIMLGREQIVQFSRTRWIPAVLGFLGIALLVGLMGYKINGVQIAQRLAVLPVVIYAVVLVSRIAPVRPRWNPAMMRQLLAMGTLFALATFIVKLNHRISLILLERLADPTELGQFSIGEHIAELIWQVPAAVGVVIFSRSANAKSGQAFSLRVAKLMRVSLVACALVGLLIGITAPWIIPLMYGEAFRPSVTILQLMLPGILVMALFKLLVRDLSGKGRPMVGTMCALPGLAVNAVLGWLLIPKYGGIGAAIASSTSYFIMCALFIYAYSRVVSISIPDIFRFRKDDYDFLPSVVAKIRSSLRLAPAPVK
jgi:O-antigen/teichoic acid export membrane protein